MAKYSHRGQVIVPMVCIAASQQSREKYAPFTSLLCQPCHLVISPTRHVGTWYGCELSRGKFPHVSTCRRVGYANLHFVLSAVSHIVEDPSKFGTWNVRQRCSPNMFVGNFHNAIM